jgi:hypothetical protein
LIGGTLKLIAAGVWEAQTPNDTGTTSTTGETVRGDMGTNALNYATAFSTYVPEYTTGIMSGNHSALWTVQANSRYVGGALQTNTGLVINTGSASGGMVVETGATIQFGMDVNSLTGRGSYGGLTVRTGAVINIVGANPEPGRGATTAFLNNQLGGVITVKGPGICGQGVFDHRESFTNNGTITIDDSKYYMYSTSTFNGGTGSITVLDGGTYANNGVSIPASSNTLYLNGCGWCNASNIQEGALLYGAWSTTSTINAPIVLQSETCMMSNGGLVNFPNKLTGNFKLKLGNSLAPGSRIGSASFTNNTAEFFDNTVEVTNTTLYNSAANMWSKADMVLIDKGYMQNDGGIISMGSLSSTSVNTGIMLNSSGGIRLKENGSTTYAGNLYNSTPGTPWPFTIEGPSTNVIRLTNPTTDTVMDLRSTNGGRIIFEGARVTSYAATGGGTISAGKKRTARIDVVTLTANDAVDVYASGATTGMLWSPNGLSLAAGWRVNLMEPLPAGTHQIYNQTVTPLPTLGTNLSGRTVTGFANIGGFLTVTLA